MARATLRAGWGSRTVDFEVEVDSDIGTVRNEDELHEALQGDYHFARELKERVWQDFLEHYDVIVAVYDSPEEPEAELEDQEEE